MFLIQRRHYLTIFFYVAMSSFFLFACSNGDSSTDVVITPIIEQPAIVTIDEKSKESSIPTKNTSETVSPPDPDSSDESSNNPVTDNDAVKDVDDNDEQEDIVHSIVDLHKRFGEPPPAKYGRLSIPALDIDAPIGISVITDGVMTNPIGPSDVVYYDFQGDWLNFGGDVGVRTNAIFSGHVDYVANVDWADIRYEGIGVFFNISLLSPGDVINIRIGERTYVYGVVWRRMIPAESDEWEPILRKETGLDMITLITCTGEFDPKTLEYAERTVVRAHRM